MGGTVGVGLKVEGIVGVITSGSFVSDMPLSKLAMGVLFVESVSSKFMRHPRLLMSKAVKIHSFRSSLYVILFEEKLVLLRFSIKM